MDLLTALRPRVHGLIDLLVRLCWTSLLCTGHDKHALHAPGLTLCICRSSTRHMSRRLMRSSCTVASQLRGREGIEAAW